ncbi:MAG: hypothetical protein AAF901_06145, partial [Bacteroidota bacterium]
MLGRFGDVPVSLYTGIPDISVPLYTVKSGHFEMPIKASYHAGGVQVSQEASFLGLGWALSAGGMITQSVNDWDDLEPGTGFIDLPQLDPVRWYDQHNDKNKLTSGSSHALAAECTDRQDLQSVITQRTVHVGQDVDGSALYYTYEVSVDCEVFPQDAYFTNPTWDTQPDVFHFNFPGYSGKFVYHKPTSTFQVLDRQNILINYLGRDLGWEIVTPEGDIFEFKEIELTHSYNGVTSPISRTFYLTKVKPYKGREIILNYIKSERVICDLYQLSETTKSSIDSGPGSFESENNLSYTQTEYFGKFLDEIIFPHGTLKFNWASLIDHKNDMRLGEIIVRNSQNGPIETISFDNDHYFQGVTSSSYITSGSDGYFNFCGGQYSDDRLFKRLKLNAINFSHKNLEYSFEYNESISLPSKLSYAQDYWGFYNGNLNANTLIPDPDTHYEKVPLHFPLSRKQDRRPNENMRAWVLKKVTYPTGGWTEYEYEPNTFSNKQLISELNSENETAAVSLFEASEYGQLNSKLSDNFTLNHAKTVFIALNFEIDLADNFLPTQDVSFQIKNVNGIVVFEKSFKEGVTTDFSCNQPYFNASIQLPVGDYSIHLNWDPSVNLCSPFGSWLQGKVSYDQMSADVDYSAGAGLRVKKTKSFDGTDYVEKVYTYHSIINGVETSHGLISNLPSFYRELYLHDICGNTYDHSAIRAGYLTGYDYNGISTSAQGSYIGYSKVIEAIKSQTEHGYVEYGYIGGPDICMPGMLGSCLSSAPRNGKLAYSKTFDSHGRLLKEIKNNYFQEQRDRVDFYGTIAENPFFNNCDPHSTPPEEPSLVGWYLNFYPLTAFRYDLKESTEYTYDLVNNEQVKTKETYTYKSKGQLATKTKTENNGKEVVTTYSYPFEFSDAIHQQLVAENRINIPIEYNKAVNPEGHEIYHQKNNFQLQPDGDALLSFVKNSFGDNRDVISYEIVAYDYYNNPVE